MMTAHRATPARSGPRRPWFRSWPYRTAGACTRRRGFQKLSRRDLQKEKMDKVVVSQHDGSRSQRFDRGRSHFQPIARASYSIASFAAPRLKGVKRNADTRADWEHAASAVPAPGARATCIPMTKLVSRCVMSLCQLGVERLRERRPRRDSADSLRTDRRAPRRIFRCAPAADGASRRAIRRAPKHTVRPLREPPSQWLPGDGRKRIAPASRGRPRR